MGKTAKTLAAFMALLLIGAAPLFMPSAAMASGLCESPNTLEDKLNDMGEDEGDRIDELTEQEQNYIDYKLMSTAKLELTARFREFGNNIAEGLSDWWRNTGKFTGRKDLENYSASISNSGNPAGDDKKTFNMTVNSITKVITITDGDDKDDVVNAINDAFPGVASIVHNDDTDEDNLVLEGNIRFDDIDFGSANMEDLGYKFETYPAGLYEQMKPMARQISMARIQQTADIGTMIDGDVANEAALKLNLQAVKAEERYAPNENACQLDSVSTEQTKASVLSRALTQGYAMDNQSRGLNSRPADLTMPTNLNSLNNVNKALAIATAAGPATEQKVLFEEYKQYFCDPDRGDQGCGTTPGTLAGQNTDLPRLIWGSKQALDLSTDDNRHAVTAVMRTMISPRAQQPVPPSVINTVKGQRDFLAARSLAARKATIAATLGALVTSRVSVPPPAGQPANAAASDIRVASGVAPDDAGVDPSYRAIQEAMGRDKFINPEYTARLIGSPTEIAREQIGINATRMQTMSDLYKRQEEMVFMEAAAYANDLDHQQPGSGMETINTRNQ